jgi:hypothetical protein
MTGTLTRVRHSFAGALALCALFACSLNYNPISDETGLTPEFQLDDAKITRYENGQLTAELDASVLEQYKRSSIIYGSGIKFTVYDEDGKKIGSGKCGLLAADNENEYYILFDSIVFANERDKFEIQADELKWAAKSGSITGSDNGLVRIIKSRSGANNGDESAESDEDWELENAEAEDTEADGSTFELSGSRFSADRNKRTFEFGRQINGAIQTGDFSE